MARTSLLFKVNPPQLLFKLFNCKALVYSFCAFSLNLIYSLYILGYWNFGGKLTLITASFHAA